MEAAFEKARQLITWRFIKFCAVGALGFCVDVALTLSLIALDLSPFAARIAAIGLTILFCWQLNRQLTFEASQGSALQEGARYFVVAALVGAINYMLYAIMLLIWPTLWPVIAITLATAACTLLSYVAYARFAFRPA